MPAVEEATTVPNGTKDTDAKAPKKDGEKISGAELKKQKKAEKAAKRAQEKGTNQLSSAPSAKVDKPAQAQQGKRKLSAQGAPPAPGLKGQDKKQTVTQKGIPLRPTQSSEKAVTKSPAKNIKRVALFGHLYGQSRRTTIAGADKEVHPAVLALGLQMSNWVICGSSARCIATLLAFKRVRTASISVLKCVLNLIGH